MKFHLNAIAATLALLASIPAQAMLSLPSTGNGSLMLEVMDRTANVSALFDLGFNYSDFNLVASAGAIGGSNNQNMSWDLASSSDYSAAWGQLFTSGATSANLQYAVIAADNNGSGIGGQGYISTFAGTSSTLLSFPLVNAVATLNNYIVNTTSGAISTLVNSFPTTTSNGALAIRSINNVFVNGKLNNVGNFLFGSVDSTMSIQQVVTGFAAVATTSTSIFPTTFTLTSLGQLTYGASPVPETETYLMLLAGLGLMGFVSLCKERNRLFGLFK